MFLDESFWIEEMIECDEGGEVKTDDSRDEKCLTLEDVSAARVSTATDSPALKDLLLLRREFLPALRDDAENNGEENASLEANYGDESSCCVSNVSSLSFQNAVLDDPEYNSSGSALVAGEHNSVGNDLEDAEELENPGDLHEIPDEIVEMPEGLQEINEAESRRFTGSDESLDDSQTRRSRNGIKDCDGSIDADENKKISSPREVGMPHQVGEKSRCEEDKFRNTDHGIGRKGQQHLKHSPGLARRMLADDGVEVSSVGVNMSSTESAERDCRGSDGEKKGTAKQEKEQLKKDAGRSEKDARGQSGAVKDLENNREKRSRDQEKRDRIAHMDAVYQKQIEALMLTQSGDHRSHGSSPPEELQTTSADVRNEYGYIKCTRVQDNKTYFGMDVVQSSSERGVGAASIRDSLSECSEAKKPDVYALKKATQSGFTELSSDTAEYDPEESSAANGGKVIACHMPSVEDGLSSGHTSDCDEVTTSRRDPSPAQALQLRQKTEVQRRPTSLAALERSAAKEDAVTTTDSVSGTRQRDVELAIQDIRSAIARSKRVKMISPSAAGEEPTKQIDKRSEEPVWITRKEQAKDLQRQPSKNQEEEETSSSSPPDLANCQKSSKSHSTVKGQVSVTRKHNRQYVALPLADNDTDQDNDSESLADSQNRTRKTQSHTADSGTDRCAGSVQPESAGQKHSDPSGPRAEMNSQLGRSDRPEESGCSSTRADEQSKAKHCFTPHGRSSEEYSVKAQNRAVEGDYSTDEETDELLNKQYTQNEKVDISELTTSPLSQSQNERRQNRAREVALRDPANETVLIEGVLFRANYLGSTQLISEGQPSKGMRMMQAQEAVGRIKAPDGENQPSTEVDLFVSVEKIMVLNTDLQEIMMDHALRTISYIADIGDILVIMARRGPIMNSASDGSMRRRSQTKICCHVFESDEAQLIAQSIGQAFQVSYMEFLKANGIDNPSHIRELDYQEVLNQQEIFGEELYLFSNREMQKEIIVPKVKGEPLGVVVVESGWGSMVPTVVLANMSPNGAAARCGQLNIGDQIMSINGISLVGLPLSTCQNYIKVGRHQSVVKLVVVSCPPVVEVLIKRPDIKYQLGFSVQNGVICSLLRGGIAERGGIRVGHRIIEINGQSVVAVAHDKIVQMLATSVGEIQMKTMPTSIFRLLTGQDIPHYI